MNPAGLKGRFIVLDGPDGCGKTTQMKLLSEALTAVGLKVVSFREPGGTPIGEQIRDLLLSSKGDGMDLRCEMLLYMASRAQLVQQQIKPALAAGDCVVTDRYASSTIAYQGGGGGLALASIMQVAEIAVDGVWPDLTLIFDISIDAARARLNPVAKGKKGAKAAQPGLFADRIEQREASYHEKVRQAYLAQAKEWPDRYRVLDATQGIQELHQQVMEIVECFFKL